MSIDLSVLKNIDFSNSDNLLFLAILLIMLVAIFFIFFVTAVATARITKKAIIRIFNVDVKKPKFNKKESTDWLHQLNNIKKRPNEYPDMPKPKIVGGDFIRNFNAGEKASFFAKASASAKAMADKSEDKEEKQKDPVISYREKEQKDILENLSKLKINQGEEKETLESKMPSRTEDQEGDNDQEIKIPRVKRFPTTDTSPKVEDDSAQTKSIAQSVSGFEKTATTTNRGVIEPTKSVVAPQDSFLSQKLGFVEDKLGTHSVHGNKAPTEKIKEIKSIDSSIFEGKSEVSRIKLKHEMETDINVWQAARRSGLTLSPVERAKLVKEVFSPTLGRNISKADLKSGIKKLNQKMSGAKNSAEHAKLRKEIKFFKKIGGI